MIAIEQTKRFKKEFDLMLKRGKDPKKFKAFFDLLLHNVNKGFKYNCLPSNYRLHKLSGQYDGCWEAHIEPDWLLIYYLDNEVLRLQHTGTHSDLFNKVRK